MMPPSPRKKWGGGDFFPSRLCFPGMSGWICPGLPVRSLSEGSRQAFSALFDVDPDKLSLNPAGKFPVLDQDMGRIKPC